MSSSSTFARKVQDAYINDNINDARLAYVEWQSSHCLHPQHIRIIDSHTQQYRRIQVPCGRCFHCMQSKINEWTTRMYAHAEDFKHVYFVTLTYRSITNPDLDVNKLFLSKLSQAVWHRDCYNSTKHLSYNPCLLVKSHYQKFLKRLRKNTGLKDLTYVLSGEFGTRYGRPHFHMVLFTNGELTKRDIIRAWSVCLWKSDSGVWSLRTNQRKDGTPYDFPIGSVDFHDLVSNGTFNTAMKIKVDGSFMNASNCFGYVAKYVVKRDNTNFNRLKLAYNGMFHKETFCKIYENEVPYNIAIDYMKKHGIVYYAAEQMYNNLKSFTYEKTLFKPYERIYSKTLKKTEKRKLFGFDYDFDFFPEVFVDFRDRYSPFCEFSRGVPIGSLYAKRNLQEFKEGVFTKPLLQDVGFVVPSYFRRKAENDLYGFRKINRTFKGTSFVFGSLQNLYGHLQKCVENDLLPDFHFNSKSADSDYSSYLRSVFTSFADVGTGERFLCSDGFARFFRYDKSKRKYLSTRNVPIKDFIRLWCVSLQGELERHKQKLSVSSENEKYQERGLCMLTDMGDSPDLLSQRFEDKNWSLLLEFQKQYDEIHFSAE